MIQGFGLPAYSGLHYEGSMELMGQIHAQRRECHENEMMKRAASGELSDRGALPIYGAVLALIGLDANRRISAETAVQACQWSAPPEKPESCSAPAYNQFSHIEEFEERRRKYERAEAIQTAMLDEFARLAARDEYEATRAPAVARPEPVAPPPAESKEARQARRYQACIDGGLKMPTDTYAHMPRGIGRLAEREGISRQAFTEDVEAHIGRLHGR